MDKCPCEECISFAICNSVMRNIEDVTHLAIERDCTMLSKYVLEEDHNIYFKKINIARKLYNLPLVSRGDVK